MHVYTVSPMLCNATMVKANVDLMCVREGPDKCSEEHVERTQTHRNKYVLGAFLEGIRDALLGRGRWDQHADIAR